MDSFPRFLSKKIDRKALKLLVETDENPAPLLSVNDIYSCENLEFFKKNLIKKIEEYQQGILIENPLL